MEINGFDLQKRQLEKHKSELKLIVWITNFFILFLFSLLWFRVLNGNKRKISTPFTPFHKFFFRIHSIRHFNQFIAFDIDEEEFPRIWLWNLVSKIGGSRKLEFIAKAIIWLPHFYVWSERKKPGSNKNSEKFSFYHCGERKSKMDLKSSENNSQFKLNGKRASKKN